MDGVIPATLANISNLQKFAITNNNLTGSIPSGLGNYAICDFCHSFGDLEFLGALTNCTNSKLGGQLPASITNLSINLLVLGLENNFIAGSIPRDIGNLVSLQTLLLKENQLTGLLPASIGKLLQLEDCDLGSNNTHFYRKPYSIRPLSLLNNSFEGTIPQSLGNCSSLRYLWVGPNKLFGTIPQEIMQIKSLIYLDMSDNSLTGSLPKDVGRLENLVDLWIGNNKLSGQLPHSLGSCLSMETLLLHGNYFYGAIPDIRGVLKNVDLSNNNLSGSIPGYFANFSSLEYLNLSINNFEEVCQQKENFRVLIYTIHGIKTVLICKESCDRGQRRRIFSFAAGRSFKYGVGGEPSIHGDEYSFGILLLEMISGKRPTDELFGGNFTLHSYIKSALPERVLDVADKSIFTMCLTMVLEVGLRCCEESPANRLETSEARKKLISIRERFFKARRTARR
ncbi:LOW QUALITY PROTEIN: hypothetical protein HID58_094031 [Brassica napus]|uniref:Uncharacterized protein n=1 Tax=Brassica napus TaxID=3708 RepID=A0ABQ7XBQ8_BRANA|nr:LOW QUALITY PROTEIN: hypothetical protein HID58_094031 [Brassica napus]